jgi:hypothetical protein
MRTNIPAVLAELTRVRRIINASDGKQIQSASENELLRTLSALYFAEGRPSVEGDPDVAATDEIFRELHELSRGRPSRLKCVELLSKAKRLLVKLEGVALFGDTAKTAGRLTATDRLIIDSLREICPTAAAAYSQAMADLATAERESWRGPATDLREALRETLDVLAPDDEVTKVPGFKLEKDTFRPTMKQKVRYILKNRGMASGAMTAPETAVQGIEDIVGGVTRSVYTRSNLSTHTATDKKEVLRVHAWVRLVFCDLLEIPPG